MSEKMAWLALCGLYVLAVLFLTAEGKSPFLTASDGKKALLTTAGGRKALHKIDGGICHFEDYVPCSSTEEYCIYVMHICDGQPDCPDGSDEDPDTCEGLACPPGVGQCSENGACLPDSWVCDGVEDCPQGSDEAGCISDTLQCQDLGLNAFQCDNNFCVPGSWVCDAFNDCGDGTDEANCTRCTDGEFQCAYSYSTCIPESWHCDGYKDCLDGSDEALCTGCPRDEFQCRSGTCIPRDWACDQEEDCSDGSDETVGCDGTEGGNGPGPAEPSECGRDMFQCEDGQCIPLIWSCDGFSDCIDGSDEFDDNCRHVNCTEWQRPCSTTRGCVPVSWWCDGTPDCADASDETACHGTPPETGDDVMQGDEGESSGCREDQYTCTGSGECVSYTVVCNGVADCPDGSDESECNFCVLEPYPDKILMGHAFYFESGWTLDQCKSECLSRPPCQSLDYLCASLEEDEESSMCYLNGDSHLTQPGQFFDYHEDNHVYFYEVCLTPRGTGERHRN